MNYKNWKVRTKLLTGFCCVIVMTVALAVFAITTLKNVAQGYDDLLKYPQQRLKHILAVEKDVMDIRRITTAINAYCGDVSRQEGYKTESANVVASINAESDYYVALAKEDASLTKAERDEIVSKAESLKTVLARYKAELIDPNIESAIINDKESVVANAAKNAPLISTLSATIVELTQYEEDVTARLSQNAMERQGYYLVIFIAIAAGIAFLSLVIAIVISRGITGPVKAMEGYMSQIERTGNLEFSKADWDAAHEMAKGKDEISSSLRSFLIILDQFIYYGKCLEIIAERDLSGDVRTVSDTDTCGVALSRMQEILNALFAEINSASAQVASGSSHVATAAQNLAEGARGQARTIELFTQNVARVRADADECAKIATDALSEVGEAGILMGECTKAMDMMLSAMHDIDAKSRSISKVIKVIDDIAFQTNILALNAAVEAARAGREGAGFSVVAGEVGSLAAKSADAAKETAALIAGSLASVKEGNLLADKVGGSIDAVAKIASANAASIQRMYTASERQNTQMRDISDAIAQLSTVVQANSATAQQTAALSQEMSAQSATLDDIVGRFKLKETKMTRLTRGGARQEALISPRAEV